MDLQIIFRYSQIPPIILTTYPAAHPQPVPVRTQSLEDSVTSLHQRMHMPCSTTVCHPSAWTSTTPSSIASTHPLTQTREDEQGNNNYMKIQTFKSNVCTTRRGRICEKQMYTLWTAVVLHLRAWGFFSWMTRMANVRCYSQAYYKIMY